MTEIIIGRNSETNQLKISVGKQVALFGQKSSVPDSVGREHAHLKVHDDGTLWLVNMDLNNSTFVNGREVEEKHVKDGDIIEFGADRYVLNWEWIRPLLPKFADISHLKRVWDEFQAQTLAGQIRERRFGAVRSVSGILMPCSALAGIVLGRDNPMVIVVSVAVFAINLLLFVIAFKQAGEVPKRNQQLREEAEHAYKCPCCGSLFPLQSYDRLIQQRRCPHCGAVLRG